MARFVLSTLAAATLLAFVLASPGSQTVMVASSAQTGKQTPTPGATPTFNRDVGPLLAKNCMACHRPGEIGPMPLRTYDEVRPWAKSIAHEVSTRTMPPWHADPRYGTFRNEIQALSQQEISTLVRWAQAGAPRGDGPDFVPPSFPEGWQIGTPDLIWELEEDFLVPANGPDLNVDIRVPTKLTEDIWVVAAEVRGNTQVVHHSMVSVLDSEGRRDPTGRLAAYTPGKMYDRFPEGSGKLIKAGSSINFGIHYHPTGTAHRDRSRVGVVLARKPLTHKVYSRAVADPQLEIPPMEPNHLSTGEFVFSEEAAITLFKPHMHYRGKDMTYILVYPDGREEIALHIPRYDMNWQISYELKEPIRVPKGTKLRVVAHFDNSPANPWNPDPTVRVLWGLDSLDEMMEGWFDYTVKMEEVVQPRRPTFLAAPQDR